MIKLAKHTARRAAVVLALVVGVAAWLIFNPANYKPEVVVAETGDVGGEWSALNVLAGLDVKDKDYSQKYVRADFYKNWSTYNGCDMRNVILQRDLHDTVLDGCLVMSGILEDPYTGKTISFVRGPGTSSAVQIDHVIALSNAWATGAQALDASERRALSQDPLNLLAADGPANQQKSDKDASEWLPENVGFRCEYVARQISVKYKYVLWVTEAEKAAMEGALANCPGEPTLGLENLPE